MLCLLNASSYEAINTCRYTVIAKSNNGYRKTNRMKSTVLLIIGSWTFEVNLINSTSGVPMIVIIPKMQTLTRAKYVLLIILAVSFNRQICAE